MSTALGPTASPLLDAVTEHLEFSENAAIAVLYGERDRNLERIEQQAQLTLVPRGNVVSVAGTRPNVAIGKAALISLYNDAKRGVAIGQGEVDAAIRIARAAQLSGQSLGDLPFLRTRKRQISARTPVQAEYIQALKEKELVFGVGPAGSGKTYLAVAAAVDMLMTGQVERLILSRPAVEAGERLGFLPGDLKEKVDPYLRPLYDALNDMLPGDQVVKRMASGEIEVAPLAFMRGRTLSRAFVILDEAQNTTPVQMKMFVTRLGEGSRMAITGDLTQIDLPKGQRSGLSDVLRIVDGLQGVSIVHFTEADVVRHPLVARIVSAYNRQSKTPQPPEDGDLR